jgi:hypothetical protein
MHHQPYSRLSIIDTITKAWTAEGPKRKIKILKGEDN